MYRSSFLVVLFFSRFLRDRRHRVADAQKIKQGFKLTLLDKEMSVSDINGLLLDD